MKPMLFNTDMVRAILAGTKTVTRRVVKPQPDKRLTDGNGREIMAAACAPYKPGDILYVRETWATTPNGQDYLYRADADGNAVKDRSGNWHVPKWRPSIHMPAEAARIFLRVTAVRVERLWGSFPNQGAVALAFEEEGIQLPEECEDCVDRYGCPCGNDLDESLPYDEQTGEDSEGGSECGTLDEVRLVFSELWDSTIEKPKREIYGSDANPWVWVIKFERCERPKEG